MGTRTREAQIAVIGGGLTGMALAIAVADAGVPVVVVERMAPARLLDVPYDGRVIAVAPGSRRLLETIGAWGAIAPSAQPIWDIHVGEAGSPLSVHYDHRDIGSEPLGHIAETRVIRKALLERAAALPHLVLEAPAEVTDVARDADLATVTLADGGVWRTALVVAAEGRNSAQRRAAGIGMRRWDYAQMGLVCTLAHEKPHNGLAVERFFPDGPFAMLPMQGNRSSIVWAVATDLAREIAALDDAAFVEEVQDRFGDDLGRLSLDGPRWSYPLSLVWSDRITDERLALVGDAARAIHPISGQGWNLALRDVAALAETVVDNALLGLDPGGAEALARYESWRRFDTLALVAITDGINRLFANDILPVQLARNLGLGIVDRVPPLKRFFMRHAAGLVGDLPRLMRGLRLDDEAVA